MCRTTRRNVAQADIWSVSWSTRVRRRKLKNTAKHAKKRNYHEGWPLNAPLDVGQLALSAGLRMWRRPEEKEVKPRLSRWTRV
jgi:hypothetical protein